MTSSRVPPPLLFLFAFLLVQCSYGGVTLNFLVEEQPLVLTYHKGALLTGSIKVNLIFYGKFAPSQRAILADFFSSLSSPPASHSDVHGPSVSNWWRTVEKYYAVSKTKLPTLTLGSQFLDESCSLGKSLREADLVRLAARGGQSYAINVVLTAADVAVERFCTSRCGMHGASPRQSRAKVGGRRFAYIWVGNSEAQCPGLCAWPFAKPVYGPQAAPLVAPNGDVGSDGMVINLASMMAAAVTNPFGNGFFQGPKELPLEAATACPGVYGKGAYPGYAGEVLVDPTTGSSYNANGVHGRKYLLPALFDPSTSSCSTLV